jgi:hypothetical protein
MQQQALPLLSRNGGYELFFLLSVLACSVLICIAYYLRHVYSNEHKRALGSWLLGARIAAYLEASIEVSPISFLFLFPIENVLCW